MKLQLLFRDGIKTQFFQSMGVFEKFKVIIRPVMTATLDKGRTCQEVAELVRLKYADTPDKLIAAWNDCGVYYRDESVLSVSDGESWCLLDDFMI